MKSYVAMAAALAGSGLCALQLRGQATPEDKPPEAKQVAVGKNVKLEVQGDRRRVLIDARVCLRDGSLEVFLTRRLTKEHESILAADIDARDLHTALYLARAKEGSPAQIGKNFVAPSGTAIKITLEYEVKGKKTRVPAQQWVRYIKTKKDLAHDWVFAGSRFHFDEEDPTRVFYGANEGQVITVSNFEDSLLDVPIESSTFGADLL